MAKKTAVKKAIKKTTAAKAAPAAKAAVVKKVAGRSTTMTGPVGTPTT